ncbi:MAG: phosphatase PAP2 family protein [Candidatus Micrarchaeota archaeon]
MSYIEDSLHSFAGNDLFKVFNFFMQDAVFAVVVLLLAVFLVWRMRKSPVVVVGSLVVVFIAVQLAKLLYQDPRPCVGLDGCETGFGFPSLHSAMSFALAGTVFGTKAFYTLIAFAVLVALSRVISLQHSFPQIVAGAVLGFLAPLLLQKLLSMVKL